jgi:hypothetical protein
MIVLILIERKMSVPSLMFSSVIEDSMLNYLLNGVSLQTNQ